MPKIFPTLRGKQNIFNVFILKVVTLLSVFFWVFPRRRIIVCRRFRTLYLFHLQGLDLKYEVYFILYIQPLKMELIEGSETSAYIIQTPGKYPKENIIYSKHGESLRPRIMTLCSYLRWFLTIAARES